MDNGWLKFYRKFLETSFFKDSYAVHLATFMILKANHTDVMTVFNNNEITVKRGSFVTGRKQISKVTGMKESTIYKKLKLLENVGFCNINSNNKFSIVTVCNYNSYNPPKEQEEQREEQQRNNSVTHLKNVKNEKNNNIAFDDHGNKFININGQIKIFKEKFPDINIKVELRAMEAWLYANPKKRKTNYEKFIVNWLGNAQPSKTETKDEVVL